MASDVRGWHRLPSRGANQSESFFCSGDNSSGAGCDYIYAQDQDTTYCNRRAFFSANVIVQVGALVILKPAFAQSKPLPASLSTGRQDDQRPGRRCSDGSCCRMIDLGERSPQNTIKAAAPCVGRRRFACLWLSRKERRSDGANGCHRALGSTLPFEKLGRYERPCDERAAGTNYYRFDLLCAHGLGWIGVTADGVLLLRLAVNGGAYVVRGAHGPLRLRRGHETGQGWVSCGGNARVGQQGVERVGKVIDATFASQLRRERSERWVARGHRRYMRETCRGGWNAALKGTGCIHRSLQVGRNTGHRCLQKAPSRKKPVKTKIFRIMGHMYISPRESETQPS